MFTDTAEVSTNATTMYQYLAYIHCTYVCTKCAYVCTSVHELYSEIHHLYKNQCNIHMYAIKVDNQSNGCL